MSLPCLPVDCAVSRLPCWLIIGKIIDSLQTCRKCMISSLVLGVACRHFCWTSPRDDARNGSPTLRRCAVWIAQPGQVGAFA